MGCGNQPEPRWWQEASHAPNACDTLVRTSLCRSVLPVISLQSGNYLYHN